MSTALTIAEVMRNAIAAKMLDLHTCFPASVESYDITEQTVDVKPLLKAAIEAQDGLGQAKTLYRSFPVIPAVPVAFPRAGDYFMSFPLKPGHMVWIMCAEQSLDDWFANAGKETEPTDATRHTLNGAVAYPGVYPSASKLTDVHADNIVIGKNGGTVVHIKNNQISLGSETPSDFVALASKVLTELGQVATAFNGHTHTGVTAGGAVTGGPSSSYTADSVASTVVRSE